MCLGGDWEVKARYMRGTCVVHVWYKPPQSQGKPRGTGGGLAAPKSCPVAGLGTFLALALCYRRRFAVCRCPSLGAFAVTSTGL
jgi:hypothetical protein